MKGDTAAVDSLSFTYLLEEQGVRRFHPRPQYER